MLALKVSDTRKLAYKHYCSVCCCCCLFHCLLLLWQCAMHLPGPTHYVYSFCRPNTLRLFILQAQHTVSVHFAGPAHYVCSFCRPRNPVDPAGPGHYVYWPSRPRTLCLLTQQAQDIFYWPSRPRTLYPIDLAGPGQYTMSVAGHYVLCRPRTLCPINPACSRHHVLLTLRQKN